MILTDFFFQLMTGVRKDHNLHKAGLLLPTQGMEELRHLWRHLQSGSFRPDQTELYQGKDSFLWKVGVLL